MDLNRVLGALLGGAARPPRRRRSPSLGPLIGGRSTEARAARAIGALAAGALAEWMRQGQAPARPAPPPAKPARRTPDLPPAAPPPAAPPRRIAATGRSPWGTAAAPPPPPAPPAPDAEDAESLLLIRAMIAAARADGTVDAAERAAIATQLDTAGLDPAERDFVLADFDRPLTPEALARQATDPMLRARLYAAAVAALGEISPAERIWLDALAKSLKLDRPAAAAIEERLAQ